MLCASAVLTSCLVILILAVMSALKTLQDKIRHLELERTQAEHNLKTLTHETNKARRASRDASPVGTARTVSIDERPTFRDFSTSRSPTYDEEDIDLENRGNHCQ